ncbi:hypothetical protein [Pseudomonas putida]|uniref:hypothetical protein n=1 Tax=Pseudomonas putida TaxID=303 RepID=UPI002B23EFD4|nr:hypothetical protein [Pseudomonas putida]
MKDIANITLYLPGIVLFDPMTLQAFLQHVGYKGSDVFDLLMDDQAIGVQAISEGVVFPIYQIPDDDYAVFIERGALPPAGAKPHFTCQGVPLHVTSGVLIAADLGALMDWDAAFFCNYRENYPQRLKNNDYLDVAPGRYLVAISGYSVLAAPLNPFGYGLRLEAVQQLPNALPDEDFNFSLERVMGNP